MVLGAGLKHIMKVTGVLLYYVITMVLLSKKIYFFCNCDHSTVTRNIKIATVQTMEEEN